MSGPKYSSFICDLKIVVKAYTQSELEFRIQKAKEDYDELRESQKFLRFSKDNFKEKMKDFQKL